MKGFKVCSKCREEKELIEFGKVKANKDGLNSKCKSCAKEWKAEYYKKNIDNIKEKKKEYYNNNSDIRITYYEKNKQRFKEYYEENKNKSKEYYEENKERFEKYYKENSDKIKEYSKEYRKTENGKEVSNKSKNKRRALKKGNGGEYTQEQWENCIEFFDNKCAYTGLDLALKENILNAEHITPITKGGTSWIWNLCPSERSANFSKHNNELEGWYRKQTYFSEERLNKIYEWMEYSFNKYGLG